MDTFSSNTSAIQALFVEEFMRLGIIVITLLFSTTLFAQRDTTTNKDVTLVGSYKPKFPDVQKVEAVPVIEKPRINNLSFNYNIKPFRVETEKIVNPIPLEDLPLSELEIYPTSFVKLGYGNIRTPLAEIYLNNKQNAKYSYGLHYRFLQSNSDQFESYMDFTRHNAKAYLSTYTKAGELGLDLAFQENKLNFYGYDTATKAAENNLGRAIRDLSASVYFNSTSTKSKKLRHRTRFEFYKFRVGSKTRENQYAINSLLYAKLPNFSGMKDTRFSTRLGFDYTTFKHDTLDEIKRFFIYFDPRFEFDYEGMKVTGGLNTTFFFSGGDSVVPFVNLVLNARYPIIEDAAELYAGIDGRYQKQSLRGIIRTNPYTTQYELFNLYENIRTYLGVSAKIGATADALFEFGFSDNSNNPLYISRGDSLNSFAIKYRQLNLLKFTAAFNYSFSESVRIGFLGNFYEFDVDSEPQAWQMPTIDGKLGMKFNIKNKVYPSIDILAMGVQKARTGLNDQNFKSNTLEALYDISAGVDYRFKKKLSAFVQANNILGTQYQRWNNYPVYGFNIIGGITMIF